MLEQLCASTMNLLLNLSHLNRFVRGAQHTLHPAPCTQLGSVFDMHSSMAAAVVNESMRNWQLTEPRDDRIELIVSTITVRSVHVCECECVCG